MGVIRYYKLIFNNTPLLHRPYQRIYWIIIDLYLSIYRIYFFVYCSLSFTSHKIIAILRSRILIKNIPAIVEMNGFFKLYRSLALEIEIIPYFSIHQFFCCENFNIEKTLRKWLPVFQLLFLQFHFYLLNNLCFMMINYSWTNFQI